MNALDTLMTKEQYEKEYGEGLKRWVDGVKGWGQKWRVVAQLYYESKFGMC